MFRLFSGKSKKITQAAPAAPQNAQTPAPQTPAAPLPAPPAPPAPVAAAAGGEGIHVPYAKLPRATIHGHYAITSMREELEAVDWYRQRAADTEDAELRAILLHNAKEEIEHFAMLLEWMRRSDPEFHHELKEYLFSEGPLTEVEHNAMSKA